MKKYTFISYLLVYLFSAVFSNYSYSQDQICIPNWPGCSGCVPEFCQVYSSQTQTWSTVYCSSDVRCGAFIRNPQNIQYLNEVCTKDESNTDWCYVGQEKNQWSHILCSSHPSCNAYSSDQFENNSLEYHRADKFGEKVVANSRDLLITSIKANQERRRLEIINYSLEIKETLKKDVTKMFRPIFFSKPLSLWPSMINSLFQSEQLSPRIDSLFNEYNFENLGSTDYIDHLKLYQLDALQESLVRFLMLLAIKKIQQDHVQKLENIFYESISLDNWLNQINLLVQQSENVIKNNLVHEWGIQNGPKLHFRNPEITTQEQLHQIMKLIYNRASQLMWHYIPRLHNDTFTQNTNHFKKIFIESNRVIHSITHPQVYTPITTHLTEKGITKTINENLTSKYDRKSLGFLDDQTLTQPTEPPYSFLSEESEFLDQLKSLYQQLRKANPYHEQGILAREIGLSAIKTADQSYFKGDIKQAQQAFQVAESMSDIALGILPYIGVGKDIYELFTGKHLLSGRDLSAFERSISFLGIALSSLSGGLLNSSQLKSAIHSTKNLVQKINQDLVSKTLKDSLRSNALLKILNQYPEAFLKAINDIEISTKEGLYSTLQFLKRAFFKKEPPIHDITNTIQLVGKKGITDYAQSIKELENFRPKVFESGKNFIARQMSLGRRLSYANMIRVGKTSAHLQKELGSSIQPISYSGKVFRVIRKYRSNSDGSQITNSSDQVFQTPQAYIQFSKTLDQRYSPTGKSALFTSLDEDTAIREFKKHHGDIKDFVVGSKTINHHQVLDLTNQSNLSKIGMNVDDITTELVDNPNAYLYPDLIRETIDQKKNFKAILAPSAVADEKANLILLEGI